MKKKLNKIKLKTEKVSITFMTVRGVRAIRKDFRIGTQISHVICESIGISRPVMVENLKIGKRDNFGLTEFTIYGTYIGL